MGIKNLAVLLGIFQVFATSEALALSVISDIDDTIKITNVGKPTDAAVRAIFSTEAFTGMSETLQSLRAPITYLSGSPQLVEEFLERFLSVGNFPAGPMILRGRGELRQNVLDYKIKKVLSILDQSSDEFILIGDDTQSDFDAYNAVEQKYPGRISAMYIHQIRGVPLPAGSIPFLTSYDLAEKLFTAGQINSSDLDRTKRTLLEEKRKSKIIAKFQICPKDYSSSDLDIQSLIRKICGARN